MPETKPGDRVRIEYLRVAKAGAMIAMPRPPKRAVVELDVTLISLDFSASANEQQPQFEMGGES